MSWPQKEMDNYSQVESDYLDKLYLSAEILSTDPEERSDYLLRSVLKLSPTDKADFNKELEENGESAALNKLEEIAIEVLSSECGSVMKTL